MGDRWTPEEWQEAKRLRMLGKPYWWIAFTLKRATLTVQQKFKREAEKLRNGPVTSRERIDRIERPDFIPAAAIDDRDRRAVMEPRDLTAAFCGDPPVGYSALDKLRKAGRCL